MVIQRNKTNYNNIRFQYTSFIRHCLQKKNWPNDAIEECNHNRPELALHSYEPVVQKESD